METREYKLNFGILEVSIDGDKCTGTYQKNGRFSGTINGDLVKATWTNEGKEGLIELDLSDNKLVGKWKQGLEEGPMRGKWQGILIGDDVASTKKDELDWDNYNLSLLITNQDCEEEIDYDLIKIVYAHFENIGIENHQIEENFVYNEDEEESFCELFIPFPFQFEDHFKSIVDLLFKINDCEITMGHGEFDIFDIEYGVYNSQFETSDHLYIEDSNDTNGSTEGSGFMYDLHIKYFPDREITKNED